MIKKIMMTLALLGLMGCGACSANLKSELDSSNPTIDKNTWETWDTCSQNVGDHPCDFTLKDQDGKDVSLYDFYGKTIVLDFSTGWCAYCQVAAQEVQHVQDLYGESDFAYITILVETATGTDPGQSDVSDWADNFGIESAPVLAGSRDLISSDASLGWPVSGWPTFYFINDDMEINTYLKGFSSTMIIDLIEDTKNN